MYRSFTILSLSLGPGDRDLEHRGDERVRTFGPSVVEPVEERPREDCRSGGVTKNPSRLVSVLSAVYVILPSRLHPLGGTRKEPTSTTDPRT